MSIGADSPISELRGVGAARAALLSKIGIETVGALLTHYPRDYSDRSDVRKIRDLAYGGQQSARAFIKTQPELSFVNGKSLVKLKISDESGTLELSWFNRPYLQKQFKKNEEYVFTGTICFRFNRLIMENPDYERIDGHELLSSARIVPVYPSTAGLSQKMLRSLMNCAIRELSDGFPENLPERTISRYALCGRQRAVVNIHFPESPEAFLTARRRLVFEELYFTQLALFTIKGSFRQNTGVAVQDASFGPFLSALPFALTDAQLKSVSEIVSDIQSGYVMNRLIQGEVGSGKTAVAMAAAYVLINNSYQVAMMAPTEVLARQHFATFDRIFAGLGIKTVLLTGSLIAAEKKQAREETANGAAAMVVGTHALIQGSVRFANLGLVITDEQHRFGVNQRFVLADKGASPHVIVMTATPIPRTLALILYGDLDISVIDRLPAGRQPIETFFVNGSYRKRLLGFVRNLLSEGRQAYFICPAIEDESNQTKAVNRYVTELEGELAGYAVGAMHGRLAPAEKADVMERFYRNEINALVSTTVVEVGVNVPNAAAMVVENAEHFGLAQLHQLRGRVGRGEHKSYCILISDDDSDRVRRKLSAVKENSDGFALSELDLQMRGPGDFFGVAQHGLPEFMITDLTRDMDVLAIAQEAAREAYESGERADSGLFDRAVAKTL